jgi:mono/diheme cytochrome c family protein
MPVRLFSLAALVVAAATAAVGVRGQEKAPAPAKQPTYECSAAVDAFFADEVWAKVALPNCLTCHKAGGDAEDSKLVLKDPRKLQGKARDDAVRHNRDAFAKMAAAKEKDQSRLLLKVVGELDHGGSDVLDTESAGYRVLQSFVRRVNTPAATSADLTKIDPKAPPFFAGVVMLDDARLLRRVTLSLAGRLPTEAELAAVGKDGLKALPGLLNAVMTEDAFYARLREGFNDIFLTVGIDGNAETAVLSYEHFEKSRLWYQKHDLTAAGDKDAQTKARYKLANDYRKALLEEPMRLVEHVVRHDRPVTEFVTADYGMQSPYTSRGYGTFDEIKDRFKNPDDPLEFVPVRLKALKGRGKENNQDSVTGFYPHAGLLGSFHYLARYPTTETNRNRLRARMYYQHFLGVDVLELAARVSDAAAAQAKYQVPTMQAPECVVCHKSLDPVAGLFQDYWRFDANFALYGKRKGGWFTDMFPAGFEGEPLPAGERWRALQWLGERTAKDPRFAVAMTEHVYYILTGRKPLLPPKDLDDPLYPAKRRAYAEQRREVERIAAKMAGSGFNLKTAFTEWVLSDFYRADGVATALADPARKAELDDVGVVRMLSPEQVERKVAAVFGEKWGRLTDQMAMLYGGIDSQEVTERAADPSGAMGAIQRILSNDVACKQVGRDFGRPAKERKLFPFVDPETRPGTSPESDAAIRKQIVFLHDRVLGRKDAPDSAEVDRTFKLFAGIVADAQKQKGVEPLETYNCRQGTPTPPPDPHYTIRAWRGVVTYLLRRPEFLYE